jgi:hypothetical protein
MNIIKAMARSVLEKLFDTKAEAERYAVNATVVREDYPNEVCLTKWTSKQGNYKQGIYLSADKGNGMYAYIVNRRVYNDMPDEPQEFRRILTRNRARAIMAFIERNADKIPSNTDLGNSI